MSVERFDLRDIAPQPWKNGAGLTREIAFGGTSSADFDWRISVAELARDAPFSSYPGVDRCIVLLRGAGMRLRSGDGRIDHALTEPLVPFAFAGELPLHAALAGGPCSDFNLMARRGVFRATLDVHRATHVLADADVTLLLCCDGAWSVQAGAAALPLAPMQALLWRAPVGTAIRVAPVEHRPAALLHARLCHDRGR